MHTIINYTEFQFYRKKYHKNIERQMNIVDAVFNRIPNVVWVNMAKTLMQEICDSMINSLDSEDPCSERHSKAVILSIFEDFLKSNFSGTNTEILSDKFKESFLKFAITNAKYPMDSFFDYEYINLLVLKKILDTDSKLSNNGKLFLNVIQTAVVEIQTKFASDSPRSKARRVIQLIKDQLKPLDLVAEKKVSQQTGGNSILKDINEAIQLLEEIRPTIAKEHFDKLNKKLEDIHKYVIPRSVGGVGPDPKDLLNNAIQGQAAALKGAIPDPNALLKGAIPDPNALLKGAIPDPNALLKGAVPDINNALSGITSNISGQVANVQDEAKRKLEEAQAKVLADASAHGEKLVGEALGKATSEITGKGQEMLGKALGNIENTPIGQALGDLKKKGLDLPTPGNLSAKIVDEIFKNFSKTNKKGYVEIREDIYGRFLGTLNDNLHSPEGRQMYLRIIDPFLTKCIDEIIDSGAVAAVSIIHLVSKVSAVREIVENALFNGFEKIAATTILDIGNLDPLEGTLFTEYVINEIISPKVVKLLETQNPLNKLYANMKIMEYEEEIIKQKQDKDYKKTLCSPYASIVSEPVDEPIVAVATPVPVTAISTPSAPTPVPVTAISTPSAPTAETVLEGETLQAIQNSLNMPGAYSIPGMDSQNVQAVEQTIPSAPPLPLEMYSEEDKEKLKNLDTSPVLDSPNPQSSSPSEDKKGGTRSKTMKKQVRLQNKQTRYSR